jgi:hypothetical protein
MGGNQAMMTEHLFVATTRCTVMRLRPSPERLESPVSRSSLALSLLLVGPLVPTAALANCPNQRGAQRLGVRHQRWA